MKTTTSRRAIIVGAASLSALALPTIAATAPVLPAPAASPDADLIELGERYEKLFLEYMDATFEWAPLSRAVHAELREKFKFAEWGDLSDKQNRKASRLLSQIAKRNGCDTANDRISALSDKMGPLTKAINKAPAVSLAGLRAKALVVLREVQPVFADHDGELHFPDDGGATRSLFDAVAALTGLTTMVRQIEARLAADATEEIAA
jgi:Spy/CpxP family protein refolding chaperone